MHDDEPRHQLFSDLERWQHRCAEPAKLSLPPHSGAEITILLDKPLPKR
jgi:hypothetical protein